MRKEIVEVSTIGEVNLDEDERALLKLPPKLATRRKLEFADMRTDIEMGAAKIRYDTHKENSFKDIGEEDEIEDNRKMKRRKQLTEEERKDMEQMDEIEAEGRRVHDPMTKHFDHGNRRATDCPENQKVTLPKALTHSQKDH